MREFLKKFKTALENAIYIDLRSLGLFRIGLGLVVLFDGLHRMSELFFYTDSGLYPRAALNNISYNNIFSIITFSGSEAWVTFILSIYALAGLCIALGYKIRPALFVAWVICVSAYQRNTMVNFGGDTLLKMCLFWSLFLPVTNCFSLDAHFNGYKEKNFKYSKIPAWGLFFQIFFLYAFTGLLKTGKEWFPEGTAGYYALSLENFATPLGTYLSQFPNFLKPFTILTLFAEIYAPVLFLLSAKEGRFRVLGVVGLMGLQTFLMFNMRLLFFPYLNIIALSALLPEIFWDKVGNRYIIENSQNIWQKINNKLFNHKFFNYIPQLLKFSASKTKNTSLFEESYSRNVFVLFCIFLVFVLNVESLKKKSFALVPSLRNVASALQLNQKWNLFAPYPVKIDGTIYAEGTTINGKKFNAIDGTLGPVDLSKAENEFWSARWRKYYGNFRKSNYSKAKQHFANYLCRKWDRENFKIGKAKSIDFHLVQIRTPPPGTPKKTEVTKAGTFPCFAPSRNTTPVIRGLASKPDSRVPANANQQTAKPGPIADKGRQTNNKPGNKIPFKVAPTANKLPMTPIPTPIKAAPSKEIDTTTEDGL